MNDPTPNDYDEPIEVIEWGAMLPDGQLARLMTEEVARLTVAKHPERLTLIKRTVIYGVWHTAT